MKAGFTLILMVTAITFFIWPASAQAPREDAIWARVASAPIVLDGVLNESSWASAESVYLQYGLDAGIPGSGWKVESGAFIPADSTKATLKFLVEGNQLYLGAEIQDVSVGGSMEFNRFDGLLMAIKDHLDPGAPKPPAEYFFSWWYPDSIPDPQPPGQLPTYVGRWGSWPPGAVRDSAAIANWEAGTVVHGLSNDDSVVDTGYTVEMRFNLTAMGYDVTQPGGDIVEWNISIYDCDGFWPFDALTFHTNRVWWQSPWGNAAWHNEVRVFARPDVTVNSGPAPVLEPEITIPEIRHPAPVIDGQLSEDAWNNLLVYTFDMRYGDAALRSTYPGVGPHRAGQFQPPVNGGEAFVLDPGDATVKMFVQGDVLYIGFDVRDQVVQFHPDFNRWDGFLILINDRGVRDVQDNVLLARRLSFQVNFDGSALPQDYLSTMVLAGDAEVGMSLKPGTTVDTLGLSADTGYSAEVAIDLTALGYPAGRGDGSLFIGIDMLDGDSFSPSTDSYGTRTWWFREYEAECCPAWVYMQEIASTGIDDGIIGPPEGYRLIGTYPNPSPRPRIRYSLATPSRVTLEVFDVRGRLVRERPLGVQVPGVREVGFDGTGQSGGMYFYRLTVADPNTGDVRTVLHGKMMLLN